MIPLPPEFESVEKGLRERTMTGQDASQRIFMARRKLGPPWHWATWKRARGRVLGSECETCGAGPDAILYVQHTVRVPRVQPYLDQARTDTECKPPEPDFKEDLRLESYAIRDNTTPEQRDCCPLCDSLSIQYRKKTGTWICNGTSSGTYCAHVFVVPAKKAAFTAAQKKDIKGKKYDAWRRRVLSRGDDWKRDALLAWIVAFRRYLTLEDTKTLCKRCAFLEDMTDLKPCLHCGSAFPKDDDVCTDCGAPVTGPDVSQGPER
jgi:ribosomal protein L37AE/L43A